MDKDEKQSSERLEISLNYCTLYIVSLTFIYSKETFRKIKFTSMAFEGLKLRAELRHTVRRRRRENTGGYMRRAWKEIADCALAGAPLHHWNPA